MSFNNLSWFLSCIVIIYGLSFFLLKLVNRIEAAKCKFAILFIFIVQFILNYINSVGIYNIYMYCNPFYRVFDFLIGMLTAKMVLSDVMKKSDSKYTRDTYVEISIIVVLIVQYVSSFYIFDNMEYYSLLFSYALYYFAKEKGIISKQLLSSKVLQKLAAVSFEFYMIHELILICFRRVLSSWEIYWVIKCIIIAIPAFVISLGLAIFANRFVTKRLYSHKIKGDLKA